MFVFVVSIRLLSRNVCKNPLNLCTMEHENISFCGIFHMETWMLCEAIYFIGRIWVMWYAQIENMYNKWSEFFHLILVVYKYKNIWAVNEWQFIFISFIQRFFLCIYWTFNHGHNFPSKRRSCQRCRLHSFTLRKISHWKLRIIWCKC